MSTLSQWVAGCDPHLDQVTVSVVDAVSGRVETVMSVPNDTDGWRQVVEVCGRYRMEQVGIEGASGLGRCLAAALTTEGVTVVEIPTRLTARIRRIDGASKTDPGDAVAIGRAVARGEGACWVDAPELERVRLLCHRRETLIDAQRRAVNELRALLIEVAPHIPAQLGRLGRSRAPFQQLSTLSFDSDPRSDTITMLVNELARECLQRLDQIRHLTRRLVDVLPPVADDLQQIRGIGPITAAQILAEYAGTNGFDTDAKMAAWAGIAPLDASSGRQQRHRLNRGGNRQINRAIHTIVITQLQHNGEAAAYVARRTSEGKTRREAIRAVKRHIIRRIWKILNTHQPTPQLT